MIMSLPSTAEEDLWNAANQGRLDDVRRILRNNNRHIDVNAGHGSSRQTALHVACSRGHVDIVMELIDRGHADINQLNPLVHSAPIHNACNHHHAHVVHALIERNAMLDIPEGGDSFTPLHTACVNGDWEIVRALLRAGVDANTRVHCSNAFRNGLTPLHLACSAARGHPVWTVRALLAYGADTELESSHGETALSMAREGGRTAVVDYLQTFAQQRKILPLVQFVADSSVARKWEL